MNYRVIDQDTYYRKGVFRHFTEDCKCSVSLTANVFRLLEKEIGDFCVVSDGIT